VGLLTGRYASRFGISSAQSERALPWHTVTLAGALKHSGYDTALVGKWHLGSKPEWGPQKFGFDSTYGSLGGATGPYDHRYQKGPYSDTWHRDGKLVREEGHVTDLLAREAIRWLEQRRDRPFFLYLAFTTPHVPIREPEAWTSRYPDLEPLSLRHYAACVSHLDDAVGQVVRTLERLGQRERTVVVFFSDNGAIPNVRNDDPQYHDDGYPAGPAGGSNAPLRGQKGRLHEGGIRVPAFIQWPGTLKPGKFAAPIQVVDWMPTLCGLAGFHAAVDLKWDGQDLWPALTGATSPSPRQFYWAGPKFAAWAVRDGEWKLIAPAGRGKTQPELFNLAADPYEQTNRAPSEPARVAALTDLRKRLSANDRDAQVNPADKPTP
jgi:arylsulfatase A-like enzyme